MKPQQRLAESNEAYGKRLDAWKKRSDAFVDTPARQAARLVGQRIRAITCIDAMGQINFEYQESHNALRAICDDEMHQLGYESLTEHRNRISSAIMDATYKDQPKSFFKFQKRAST